MKNRIAWLVVLLVFGACASQKGLIDIKKNPSAVEPRDSIEYELITFDAKFQTWYVLQKSPANYHTQDYYESWNRRYVSEWNYLAMHPGRNNFFEPIEGYDPTTDYGFELNHKLFYYFQYVENVLKIKILSVGPVVPLF